MGLRNQSTVPLDESKNNIIHYAALWRPTLQLDKVSGEALQMQREIQWFQGLGRLSWVAALAAKSAESVFQAGNKEQTSKEVERVVKPSYREMVNKDGTKPRDLFAQEHKVLMTEVGR